MTGGAGAATEASGDERRFVLHFTTTAGASADAHALARPGLARFDLVVDVIALVLAIVLLAGGYLAGWLVAGIAILSLVGSRFHPFQRAMIWVRFRALLGRLTTVTIDEEGIRTENELGTSFVPWTTVDTVHSTRRTVAFFRGAALLAYVPSSAFASMAAQADLAAFAVSKIPPGA